MHRTQHNGCSVFVGRGRSFNVPVAACRRLCRDEASAIGWDETKAHSRHFLFAVFRKTLFFLFGCESRSQSTSLLRRIRPPNIQKLCARDLPHTSPVESVGCWIMQCFERFFSAAAVSRSTPDLLGLDGGHTWRSPGGPGAVGSTICFDDVGDNWCREEGFDDG